MSTKYAVCNIEQEGEGVWKQPDEMKNVTQAWSSEEKLSIVK